MIQEIVSTLKQGGPLMVPIGLCSLTAVAVLVQKAYELRRGRIMPAEVIHWLSRDVLTKPMPDNPRFQSPLAILARTVIQNRQFSMTENRQLLQSLGQQWVIRLQRGLRTLEIITTIAPLLGLAGTIQGLILLFGSIDTAAGIDNSDLATGIGIALFTTFAGLLVSIPSVIGWHILHRKVDVLAAEMETHLDAALLKIYQPNSSSKTP